MGQRIFATRLGDAHVIRLDFGRQRTLRLLQITRDPFHFRVQSGLFLVHLLFEGIESIGGLLAFFLVHPDRGFLFVDFFQCFEDFIRQDAIGLFVGGDLFLK